MWPPGSPDLNICNFYFYYGVILSRYLQSFAKKTLDDLKASILSEIQKISKNILKYTF